MSNPTTTAPSPVAGAVTSVTHAAETLTTGAMWQLTDTELTNALADIETAFRRLEYARLRLLAEFQARDLAGQYAALSTAAFLRQRLRISPTEASRRVHAARELVESVAPSGQPIQPELPATAAAGAAGQLSAEHAQAISAAVRRLPNGLDNEKRAEAEEFLAAQARDLDPAQLRVVARRLHAVLDPDGTLESDRPARRELSFRRDVDGMDVFPADLIPKARPPFRPRCPATPNRSRPSMEFATCVVRPDDSPTLWSR